MTAAASGRVWASEGPVISYSTKLSNQGGLVWNDPSAGAAAQNAAKLYALFTGMTAKQYLELDRVDRGPLYHDGSLRLPVSNSIRSAGGPQWELVNTIRQLQNDRMAANTGGDAATPKGGTLLLGASTGLIIENVLTRRLTAECCRVQSMSRVSNVLTVILHPSGRPAPWILGEVLQGDNLADMDFNPDGTGPAYTGGYVLSVSADGYTVVIQQTGLGDATYNAAINAPIVRAWRLKNHIHFEVTGTQGAYIRPGYVMSVTGGSVRPRTRLATTLSAAYTSGNLAANQRILSVATSTGAKVNGNVHIAGGVLSPDTCVSKILSSTSVELNKPPIATIANGTAILFGDTSLEVSSMEVARVDGQIISFRDAGIDDIGTLVGSPVLTQDPTTSRGQISGWRGAETRDNCFGILDYGSIGTTWKDVTCSGQGGMVQGGVDHHATNVGAIDTVADGWRWRGQVGGHVIQEGWSRNTGDDGIAILGGEGLGRAQRTIRVDGFRGEYSRARGVAATGVSNLEVVDGTYRYCWAAGVHTESGGIWNVLPGNDISIERNTMHGCGSTWNASVGSVCGGVGLYGTGVDVRVAGNKIYDSHFHGIWAYNIGKLVLDDNLVSWTPTTNIVAPAQIPSGIFIGTTGTYESDLKLTRNVIREPANAGIYLAGQSRSKAFLDDNEVEDIGRGVSTVTNRRGLDAVAFAGQITMGRWTHQFQTVDYGDSILMPTGQNQQVTYLNARRVFPSGGAAGTLHTKRDHRADGTLAPDQAGSNLELCAYTNALTWGGGPQEQRFILTDRARRNGFVPALLRHRANATAYIPGQDANLDIPFCYQIRDAAAGGGNLVFNSRNGAGTSNVLRQPGAISGNYIGRPAIVLRPAMVNGSSVLRFSWANRMDDITYGMDVFAASGITGMPWVAGINPENQTVCLSVAVPTTSAGGVRAWSVGLGATRLTAALVAGSTAATLNVACPVAAGTQAIFGRGIPFADPLEGTSDTIISSGFGGTSIVLSRPATETGTFPVFIYQPHNCSVSQSVDVTFSGYIPPVNNPSSAGTKVRALWARNINFGTGNMPAGTVFEVYGVVGEQPARGPTLPTAAGVLVYPYAASIAVNAGIYDQVDIGTLTGAITLANPTGTTVDDDRLVYHLTQDGTGTRAITMGAEFRGTPAAFTTGGAASTKASIEFVRKNGEWRFMSWSGWNA